MKVDVYGTNGKATGRQVELPDEIFGIEPNEHAVYLDVKAIQANARQGTHKAKERGEIAGSTKKIKKQKGTGTARAGSIKNPLFKGGGRVFGPRPRSYGQKLNKKVKRLARISALSAKSAAGAIMVVEDFTFDQPKTKEYVNVLKNLELANSKTLFVVPEMDQNLVLSQRNVKESRITLAKDINTLEIMKANKLLISEASVDKIKETLSK